ncbi:MAG: lipid II:glycine glycyltransferase FemX [Candidatus Limnocylindria bacterium]
MTVRPALDSDRDAWQGHLATSPAGDFLHDWGWGAVAALDGEPQRRYVLEDEGRVVAIAAAQVRRLPGGRTFWYVPHGPVLDYDHPRAAEWVTEMLGALVSAGTAQRAIAIRLEPRVEAGSGRAAAFRGHRLRRRPSVQVGQTRVVSLGDDQALLADFDRDTRYAVRRAAREGVEVTSTDDPGDREAVDELYRLVGETQRRAGFPMPRLDRYRVAWQALAGEGRAAIFEARRSGELVASAMLVIEGHRSYYLFAGSRREQPGEPKRYASYALQWAMLRYAREHGAREHDLWGVAPPGAGPEHPWHGVGLFKKGFGGREVVWAGSFELVLEPTVYRLREALAVLRGWARRDAAAVPPSVRRIGRGRTA